MLSFRTFVFLVDYLLYYSAYLFVCFSFKLVGYIYIHEMNLKLMELNRGLNIQPASGLLAGQGTGLVRVTYRAPDEAGDDIIVNHLRAGLVLSMKDAAHSSQFITVRAEAMRPKVRQE